MRASSTPSTVFMFSGQGSQSLRMGKDLYDHCGVFRDRLRRLDAISRELAGESVIDAIYSPAAGNDVFDRTLVTHPAIFAVEYSLAQCLTHAGIVPQVVLGASLGSFAAAAVAGVVDAESAMAAVIKQALALEACCLPGVMIAVLADPAAFIGSAPRADFEIAAVNFPKHFTIATSQEAGTEIELHLRNHQMTYQRLPVRFAFHSRWIDAARLPFLAYMDSISLSPARIPLLCCEQATTLTEVTADYFWRVVRRPIRFQDAIAHLERLGAHRYIDLGPAGTLATFLKYGMSRASASTLHSVLTPFGRDRANLDAVLALAR